MSDEDVKYLIEDFGSENLELLNKKVLILKSIWAVLKDLIKKNYLPKNIFLALQKKEKLMMMVKYQLAT